MTSLELFGKLKRREMNLDPRKLNAPTTTILSAVVLFDLQSLACICFLAWSCGEHKWEEARMSLPSNVCVSACERERECV